MNAPASGTGTGDAQIRARTRCESDSLGVASTAPTEFVYDFGGFHPMYHRMGYDTPTPATSPGRSARSFPIPN